MKRTNYYRILNITPQADDEQVRQAYRALALRWHPDRNPENRAQAARLFMQVNKAYTILKTAPQRRAYNNYLLSHMAAARNDNNRGRPNARTGRKLTKWADSAREIFWPFTFNTTPERDARHG